MKGFLVLVVVGAAALGGILYWRRLIQAPRAPIVAGPSAPAKGTKERRHRRRRGARRVGRNDVFVASAPADAPSDYGAPPREDPRPDERSLPGAAEATDPSDDVFGTAANGPAPSASNQAVAAPEPAPRKLSTADLRTVAQGEDLSKPEVTRLDLSDSTPELTQDQIDAHFHAKEDAVLGCISRARPDAYTWIPGRVSVTFRILRAGGVKGVRVEAPAILQRGGLYGCVKGVVGGLKFPAGTMNQVVTYPFSLT